MVFCGCTAGREDHLTTDHQNKANTSPHLQTQGVFWIYYFAAAFQVIGLPVMLLTTRCSYTVYTFISITLMKRNTLPPHC